MTTEALIVFIITVAVAGLIVGAVARVLVPGGDDLGLLGTIGAGIAGSFIGALASWLLFKDTTPGFIMSVLGAVLVVALVSRRRRVYY